MPQDREAALWMEVEVDMYRGKPSTAAPAFRAVFTPVVTARLWGGHEGLCPGGVEPPEIRHGATSAGLPQHQAGALEIPQSPPTPPVGASRMCCVMKYAPKTAGCY